jgi:hypothetical protein
VHVKFSVSASVLVGVTSSPIRKHTRLVQASNVTNLCALGLASPLNLLHVRKRATCSF